MEIILKEDIIGLGYKNEIVNVKNGYGRNYLIPTGKGVIASVSARKVLAENLKQQAAKLAAKKAEAEKMLVQAKAEREANELKTASLTPAILQKMWIEKWNGEIPQVMTSGNSSTFLDISKLK